MLDLSTRTAVLRLAQEGHARRQIARALGISRTAVAKVLASGEAQVPAVERASQLDAHEQRVRDLMADCRGNRVRVWEELRGVGVDLGYTTLTDWLRERGIGAPQKKASGRYEFAPGVEMQHDTSPHRVVIAGREQLAQCASLVLGFSRMQSARVYPRWSRLECRHFFTQAVPELGGAAGRCVVDNSSVVLASGSGEDAVVAEELRLLGERFGFVFWAHKKGDANRSAKVERPFWTIESNFYPGRTFGSLDDLNAQLRAWCERRAKEHRRDLKASPIELWQHEREHLRPVPIFVPEVYDLHRRRVDVDGYVALHANAYPVPARLIGRDLDLREAVDEVQVFDGHRLVCTHSKLPFRARVRLPRPEGWDAPRRPRGPDPPSREESLLRRQSDALGMIVTGLRKKHGGQALKAVRRLFRIWEEYPKDAVLDATEEAARYGLCDIDRIERMVLRRLGETWFRLPTHEDNDEP